MFGTREGDEVAVGHYLCEVSWELTMSLQSKSLGKGGHMESGDRGTGTPVEEALVLKIL